jgi:hypothetical protein
VQGRTIVEAGEIVSIDRRESLRWHAALTRALINDET